MMMIMMTTTTMMIMMMMMMIIIISINYKTGGICTEEGRPTNTGCQNTPT
jgi:hypothetical protein